MRTWKDVATLVKTRGLNGRFVVRSAAGLPFILEEGMRVAFVPPQVDVPREGVVAFVRELDFDSCEVEFDSIEDENAARALVGAHCLVRREDIDEEAIALDQDSWADWTVASVSGEVIGAVSDVVENPGQSLLQVTRADGSTVLIPLVDDFIASIDEEEHNLVMDLPEGLLEL